MSRFLHAALLAFFLASSAAVISAQSAPPPVTRALPVALDDSTPKILEDSLLENAQLRGVATAVDKHDSLTFRVGSQKPKSGAVAIETDGKFTYTPSPNFNGIDSFSFEVLQPSSSGELVSNEGIVTITVDPFNDAPRAIPFLGIFTPGRDFAGQLQAYDVDDPRDSDQELKFRLVAGPSSLVISSDGEVLFTPPQPNFKGTIDFTFEVRDKDSATALAVGKIIAGDGLGFVGDTLLAELAAVSLSSDKLATPDFTRASNTPARIHDLVVDPTGRMVYALTSDGLVKYYLPPLADSFMFIPEIDEGVSDVVISSIKGTHLALSPDARTLFVADRGSVSAVNLFPEGAFENGDQVWLPRYGDARSSQKRVWKFTGPAEQREIAAMGVHPDGDRLFVVFAGSEKKVAVNNDLLRSDVGNGIRSDQLTEADLPSDFGFITQLDIRSPVHIGGGAHRPAVFAAPVDIKELIYTAPKKDGRDPVAAVGIRSLAFTPDGNCLLLTAVGGQTVRATAFGIMPTTDEGTGGIVVFDVRPPTGLVAGETDLPWIKFLRLIPTTEKGENTAELRAEIRREGWRIVHPEVRWAHHQHLLAQGANALGSLTPLVSVSTQLGELMAADVHARLRDSFEDYGYMDAYVRLYPRDMVGASSLAVSHFGDFGVVALQDTNNLGFLSLPPRFDYPNSLEGYGADHLPDFGIESATGKTINGPGGTVGGLDNYRYAYPQELAFSADDSLLFIGMAGGPPRADNSNKLGVADATVLREEMRNPDSVFSGANPPPGYTLVTSGFLRSPRQVAAAPNPDHDGDGVSSRTEANNRWNVLRTLPVGNKEAMVATRFSEGALHRLPWLEPDPTRPLEEPGTRTDDAWLRSFFLPASGLGYRRATFGDSTGLAFGAASKSAVAIIEQLGRRWHEDFINGRTERPYFIVGVISTPGGQELRNALDEPLQYGTRNAFQVNFPYFAVTPQPNSTPVDRPHDFVLSNSPALPASAGVGAASFGPRDNRFEVLEGFDALHTAYLLRQLTRERIGGRFVATKIEIDPAVRYLLTEPALSDPKFGFDQKVRDIAYEIDFGSPRFVYRGVRGPDSRSRRDHDAGFSVTFSTLELVVNPGQPPTSPTVDPTSNPPAPVSVPPAPGRHHFVVTIPPLPTVGSDGFIDEMEVWFPPFGTPQDPSVTPEDIFVIWKSDGTILQIGEKYRLADLLDPVDPANPEAPRTITLAIDVDPRSTYDWQLAIEILSAQPGSLYSLRDRFEHLQWTPLTEPTLHKLEVMPRGGLPNASQTTWLRAETVGFSAPVRYRRHNWVPASYVANTRFPSTPRIDPVSGQIIAGEDPGTLSVVAFADTPEGEELSTPPFEIKIGLSDRPVATQPGKILLGTHDDRIQIEMIDRSGRALTIRPPTDSLSIGDPAKAITFPQGTGIDRQLSDGRGRLRQILTADSLFEIISSEGSGYHVALYERPESLTNPQFDPVNGVYALNGFTGPIATLEVDGPTVRFSFEQQTQEHRYTHVGASSWEIAEHTNKGTLRRRATAFTQGESERTVTHTIMDAAGTVFSREKRTFVKKSYGPTPVDSSVPDAEWLNTLAGAINDIRPQQVEYYVLANIEQGVGEGARTTVMTYANANKERLLSTVGPDGSYEHFAYDDPAHPERITSRRVPWATQEATIHYFYNPRVPSPDGPLYPDKPRTTVTTVGGAEISRQHDDYYYDSDGALVHESSISTGGEAFLKGKTIHYPRLTSEGALNPLGGRVRREELPDGTVREYEYFPKYAERTLDEARQSKLLHFDGETQIVTTQRAGQGTIVTTVVDAHQRQIDTETRDLASDALLSRDKATSFDTYGRSVGWTHLDGRTSSIIYDGDHVVSETDRSGLTTNSTYDALGRLTSRTSLGVTMEYVHDVLGRQREVKRQGQERPVARTEYADQFSRSVEYFDALDRRTRVVTTDAFGAGTLRTATLPGGFTHVEELALDGQLVSIYGTAVRSPAYYDYRVEEGCTIVRAIAADPAGEATGEWTETWTDAAGRVVKVVAANGATTQYDYDAHGRLSRTTDPDLVVIEHAYPDDLTEEVSVPAADSGAAVSTRIQTRYADGYAVTTTTASGLKVREERVRLDGLGATTIEFDTTTTTEVTFAGSGNWTERVTTPDGTVVSTYEAGRLAKVEDQATGKELAYDYDGYGRLNSVTDLRLKNITDDGLENIPNDRRGRTTTTYFDDDQPHVVTSPHPEGTGEITTTYTYDDPRGLLTRRELPDDTDITYSYDSRGLVKAIGGSASPALAYDYDAQGRPLSLTTTGEAGPATTRWSYEPTTGRLSTKTYDGSTAPNIAFTYTPAGRLHTRKGGRGFITTYGYHNDGRLASTGYSDTTPGVSYRYATHGGISRIESRDYRYDYTYDEERRRPLTEQITTSHGTYTLARGYTGFRYTSAELSVSGGASLHRVTYGHDAAGRIDRITAPLYPTPPPPPAPPEPPALPEPPVPHTPVDSDFTYRYLAKSDLIDRIAGPAHTVAQSFQPQGTALRSRTHTAGSATVSSYAYRSDSMGRRIRSTWTGTAFEQPRRLSYRYDSRGHLTDVVPSTGDSLDNPGTALPEETFAFGYDPLGNRKTARLGPIAAPAYAETYTPNLLNQYTGIAVSGAGPPLRPNRSLAYDDDGNLKTDERWTYKWDAENRLVSQQTHLGITPALRIDYGYDHQGRRLTKQVLTLDSLGVPTGTQSALLFLYDGWRLLAELDLTTSTTAPPPLRTYTWGLDLSATLEGAGGTGGLLAVTTHGDTPATAYPTYDGAGNITQWLDASGIELAHTEYGPFGEILRQRGQAPAPFGFSTKYTEAETGYLYYGFRYYDPRAGRWLNRDPLEEQDGPNLYAFVGNDPLGRFDALGLEGQSTLGFMVNDVFLDSGYWKSVGRNMGTFGYAFGNSLYTGAKAAVVDLPVLAYQIQKHQLRMLTDKRYRNQFNDIIRICISDPSVRSALYEALKGQFQGALHATLEDLKTEEGIMKALGGLGAAVVTGGSLKALKAAGSIGKAIAAVASPMDHLASFASRKIGASIRRAGAGLRDEIGYQIENVAYQIQRRTGFDPLGRAYFVDPGRPMRAAAESAGEFIGPMRRGVAPILERSSKSTAAQVFEDAASGAASDIASGRKIVPGLFFDNPNLRGRNFVRFDGMEGTRLIDRKLNVTTKSKQIGDLQRMSEALSQNLGFQGVIQVPNAAAQRAAINALRKAGVSNIAVEIAH